MEVAELKGHIQNRKFNPFYIFEGVEWKVQRIYIEQIARVTGKELRYVDSITDIYGKITNTSFIKKSYIYVVRDDKELMSSEKLQSQLLDIMGNNILIMQSDGLDKRTKFYKAYKDVIIEFEPLKPQILKKYIQKEIALSDANCDKLMEICEYDYGRCLLEIDKIQKYRTAQGLYDIDSGDHTGDDAFKILLNNGIIYQPPKDAIFDFVDAILDKKVDTSFDLYQQCLAVGESVMVMLTVLYNNAKATLQVQSCKSSDIGKATGLSYFQITNVKKHCKKYSNRGLINIMRQCQKCQQGIVTGTMDEEYVMEYILTNVLGGDT